MGGYEVKYCTCVVNHNVESPAHDKTCRMYVTRSAAPEPSSSSSPSSSPSVLRPTDLTTVKGLILELERAAWARQKGRMEKARELLLETLEGR